MFVAKTMRNQFGVLDRVLIRRKFESHSVSDRYPIPHVKIVSRHDSLINREFGLRMLSRLVALEHPQDRTTSEVSSICKSRELP